MTTRVFYANDGDDRLIVRTIRTRLGFFDETGVAFSSERKVRAKAIWWKPATWRGFRWQRCDAAEQPRNLRCLFNGRMDPVDLGATLETSPGYFKLSCDSLAIRRHCVWAVQGDGDRSYLPSLDRRASGVRDIEVHFDYGGRARTVLHAGMLGAMKPAWRRAAGSAFWSTRSARRR